MAERPINFTEAMVAAIEREIDVPGTGKTQTRRICREQNLAWETASPEWDADGRYVFLMCGAKLQSGLWPILGGIVPPWSTGDRLWLRGVYYQYGEWREDVAKSTANKKRWAFVPADHNVLFVPPADGFWGGRSKDNQGQLGWYKRLGRFMPRAYSRLTLTLTVTDVRVQRLQDISEKDARAEGCAMPYLGDGDAPFEEQPTIVSSRMQFRNLWKHINGPGSWEANPWVTATTFRPERGNIDAGRVRSG